MDKYMGISNALCDWFVNQEVTPTDGVATMGYLIGVMAANMSKNDPALAMKRLDTVYSLMFASMLITITEIRAKGRDHD